MDTPLDNPDMEIFTDKEQRVNIYMDSKYAFLTLHAHASIWKERQFKTATGERIKHFKEIERLLTAKLLLLLLLLC